MYSLDGKTFACLVFVIYQSALAVSHKAYLRH